MTIKLREGTKSSPATASVKLPPNIGDTAYLGAGSTLSVTFEVFDADDRPLGATEVSHTVTESDRGFDQDLGGIALDQAMRQLCNKVVNSTQPVQCEIAEMSGDHVEFSIQPVGANGNGVDYHRVTLTEWRFTPISPPVVAMSGLGVAVLQNAGTPSSPAVIMLSGSQWPPGASITLRFDTNVDDPGEVGIRAEEGDTAQSLAGKVAAFFNAKPTWRAETRGGSVNLYAAGPAAVVSVNATANIP